MIVGDFVRFVFLMMVMMMTVALQATDPQLCRMAPDQGCTSKPQGESLCPEDYPAAYNAPASVLLIKDEKPGDMALFINAAFLYWCAHEEGLEVASSAALVTATNGDLVASPTSHGQTLPLDYSYRPGFKLGLGAISNEWGIAAEYTWIRQSAGVAKAAPASGFGTPVWISNDWFQQLSIVLQPLSATYVSAHWNLGMDLVDLSFMRSFYEGQYVSVTPFAGLRGAWIRQKFIIAFTEAPGIVAALPSQPIYSDNHSNCWGLGPRLGAKGHLLLPMEFRLEAKLATSLLYTDYSSITHKEGAADALAIPTTIGNSSSRPEVRSILEAGLGVGWGTYLNCQRYHIDFSADYEFSYFWSQNMMRKIMDEFVIGVGGSAGELVLYGLTLNARFDF